EDELAERKERIAQLQIELSDTRIDMARFEYELEIRLGGYMRRLQSLRESVDELRRKASWKAQWGDREDAPDFEQEVTEQYRRTWRKRPSPPKPPPEVNLSDEETAELKRLFYSLAKRFHPDLATDPNEKRRRQDIMVKVNQAYSAKDLKALRQLMKQPDVTPEEPVKSRQRLMVEMEAEIKRLDGVIAHLNAQLRELIHSNETVRLMLDVSIARQRGQDLIAEMARDFQHEIARLEVEMERLQS
ncbi:MAG: J domain-containing protein, partial [Anaerolineales bacterium]